MKTLLWIIEQKSNYTSNLGLKFWWWALETIIHRFYSEGFWSKQKKLHFTRPNILCGSIWSKFGRRIQKVDFSTISAKGVQPAAHTKLEQKVWESSGVSVTFLSGFGRQWPKKVDTFQANENFCIIFFIFWAKGDPQNPSKPFLMIFIFFLEILSFERTATIDSERQFWTALNPNPAHVLIRSRYLFWSLDLQIVSSRNQSNPRKDFVAGTLFNFFVMQWVQLGDIMILEESVAWSLDFFWGILCGILFQH